MATPAIACGVEPQTDPNPPLIRWRCRQRAVIAQAQREIHFHAVRTRRFDDRVGRCSHPRARLNSLRGLNMRPLLVPTTAMFLCFAGCSDYPREPSGREPAHADVREVVVQVCAATGFRPDFVPIAAAYIRPNEAGGNSITSGGEPANGLTTAGQFVYEERLRRQIDLAAVIVKDDADHEFVFFMRHPPLTDLWTDWEDPQSQNPAQQHIAFQIIDADAGRKPTFHARTILPFRARFRAIRSGDYRLPAERKKAGMIDDIPAC
jgi:hypothetical protein